MKELATILGKSITRYILPGVSFVVFVLWIPFKFFFPAILSGIDMTDPTILFISALMSGYLLDSIGAYGFTLSFREYGKLKQDLASLLNQIRPEEQDEDPDSHLASVWIADSELYDGIFVDRAEWVMILETSFCMALGGIVLILAMLIQNEHKLSAWITCIILISLSWLASKKGLQRMQAHNLKVIAAVRRIMNNTSPEAGRE